MTGQTGFITNPKGQEFSLALYAEGVILKRDDEEGTIGVLSTVNSVKAYLSKVEMGKRLCATGIVYTYTPESDNMLVRDLSKIDVQD